MDLLPPFVGAAVILFALGAMPAKLILRTLDPAGPSTRHGLMLPATAMLLHLGLAGWSVVLFRGWWPSLFLLMVLGANLIAFRSMRAKTWNWHSTMVTEPTGGWSATNVQRETGLSVIRPEDPLEASIVPLAILAASITLLPLLVLDRPLGVDWIGFAVLSNQFALEGSLLLPAPSVGRWTYPPAFPALAAWLSTLLDLGADDAVFILGHLGFATLLPGLAGAMHRRGAGAWSLLACFCASGLFAKVLDSGWPTVLSQLGMVLGLLTLLDGNERDQTMRAKGLMAIAAAVVVIHPTGSLFLGLLMIAHALVVMNLGSEVGRPSGIRASMIVLTVAAAGVLLLFAPRLLSESVTAEYGWQGGRPMLIYNAPLVLYVPFAGRRLWHTLEGRVLVVWILMIMALSMIHLAAGLQQVPVASLLSFTLYSMALHGFHLPFAALVGMSLARSTDLTPMPQLDATEMDVDQLVTTRVPPRARSFIRGTTVVCVVALVMGSSMVLIELGDHDELHAQTPGDLALGRFLTELPEDSIVLTEHRHWGYRFDRPADLGVTSAPDLGLIDVEASIQNEVLSAVRRDDATALNDLGITHALSSPIGTLGWDLARSPWWSILEDRDGSRLWALRDVPNPSMVSTFITPTSEACENATGCDWRPDPWRGQRFVHLEDQDDHRAHLRTGTIDLSATIPTSLRLEQVRLTMMVEAIGPCVVLMDVGGTIQRVELESGWTSLVTEDVLMNGTEIPIHIELVEHQGTWINPLGFTGRTDRILDEGGLRIHWMELRREPVS